MAPSQTLKWIESGKLPSQQNVEIEGTEPYVVGGHTGSGYWIDTGRRTTLRGLYAAGDVAGGAPKKFVTGALAEGKLAMESILTDLDELSLPSDATVQENAILASYAGHLSGKTSAFTADALEEAMQKVMDDYAGGIRSGYRYNEGQLRLAEEKIVSLAELAEALTAEDADGLLKIYELKDRLVVCRVLIAHLLARKETRWPGFGVNTDHPAEDPAWSERYVNSRLNNGKVEVIFRSLVKGGHAMSIRVKADACHKCGRCVEACPGNLIKPDKEKRAYIKRPRGMLGLYLLPEGMYLRRDPVLSRGGYWRARERYARGKGRSPLPLDHRIPGVAPSPLP